MRGEPEDGATDPGVAPSAGQHAPHGGQRRLRQVDAEDVRAAEGGGQRLQAEGLGLAGQALRDEPRLAAMRGTPHSRICVSAAIAIGVEVRALPDVEAPCPGWYSSR